MQCHRINLELCLQDPWSLCARREKRPMQGSLRPRGTVSESSLFRTEVSCSDVDSKALMRTGNNFSLYANLDEQPIAFFKNRMNL